MPDMIVKKDGTDYPLQTMPLHYPADRVYRHGNILDDIDSELNSLKFPRQKNLGTFTTTAQLEAFLSACNVSTGKFDGDVMIGDYVTIAGYKCYVAGFDTEYLKGNSSPVVHHISFIANFGYSKMNSTDTTSGGYEGASTMQTFLSSKATELEAICSTHLINRSCLTTNAVSGGKSSGFSWYMHKLTLLSEPQIYGFVQWGNSYDTGEAFNKLPIFNLLSPATLFGRTAIFLRGVGNDTDFCVLDANGNPYYRNAGFDRTVVALFCIG